jgi:hypothetical protein
MRWTARLAIAAGIVLLAAAVAVVVWPLHANGVTGTALLPHYHEFGFTSPDQLPLHLTKAELRHAGIRLPEDVVAHRRHIAELLAAIGLVVCVAAYAADRLLMRRRQPGSSD